MEEIKALALKLIQEQELIIGPVAWEEAAKVSGLTINLLNKTCAVDQSMIDYTIIDRLVFQYEKIFGSVVREVSRSSIEKYCLEHSVNIRHFKCLSRTNERLPNSISYLYNHSLELASANLKFKEFDEIKSEYTSLATHQIFSPMTLIKGYISLIEEESYGKVPLEMKAALKIVQESIRRLEINTREYLDFSAVNQEETVLSFSTFDLDELLREIIQEYTLLLKNKGLEINYLVYSEPPFLILADKVSMRKALISLFNNSIKYTQSGSIEVELYNEVDKLFISISDNGVRSLPDLIPAFFKKKFNNRSSYEARIIGNSLSLYVVSQIIETHRGQFIIDYKEKNHQTTFIIIIPSA